MGLAACWVTFNKTILSHWCLYLSTERRGCVDLFSVHFWTKIFPQKMQKFGLDLPGNRLQQKGLIFVSCRGYDAKCTCKSKSLKWSTSVAPKIFIFYCFHLSQLKINRCCTDKCCPVYVHNVTTHRYQKLRGQYHWHPPTRKNGAKTWWDNWSQIVIILVTAALRIHTSRSRRRRSEAAGGHGRPTTDKVDNLKIVTCRSGVWKTHCPLLENCHATEESEAFACARRCQSSHLTGWWTQKE
jgi:hypothetical protein